MSRIKGNACWWMSLGLGLIFAAGFSSALRAQVPISDAITVAAGHAHTCALTGAGGAKCWGNNFRGQLGDGSEINRPSAVPVSGLGSGLSAIATGASHSCALTTGGGVKCWGANGNGRLGDGSETDRLTAVDVLGLGSGVIAITVGDAHSCALTNAGAVKCWGENTSGTLGDGTETHRPTAVNVSGLTSGVVAIAAGNRHTCALTTTGGVKCWGDNQFGQLGDMSTMTRLTAVDVSQLGSGVKAIAAGGSHSCALTIAGEVRCWGRNQHGQLGDDSTTDRSFSEAVGGLASGVKAIAAGGSHSCAVNDAGGVKCWGGNSNGQLGDNSFSNRLLPVDVSGLASGVAAIAAGSSHSCAVTSGGAVTCWGSNDLGQVGDGSSSQRLSAVAVGGLGSGAAKIAAGASHSCALNSIGGVQCWGENKDGRVGDGTTTQRLAAVQTSGLTSGVLAVAAGFSHSCAVTGTGGAKCWGNNSDGQLGDNSTTTRLSAVDVSGFFDGAATAIATGAFHSCALTAAGGVKCWGFNVYGQLGDDSTTSQLTAVDVTGLTTGITQISVGSFHSCALTAAGGVKCWGINSFGQLGNDSTANSATAVEVSGLASGIVAIAAGGDHTCALSSSGAVKCWGDNQYGQLGDGSQLERLTAVNVSGLSSGVAAIAVGKSHSCALTGSGGVKCWGENSTGQLGDNSTGRRLTPVDVAGLAAGVTAIAAGDGHSCAVTSGAGAVCWGDNRKGQLGDGTSASRLVPVNSLQLTAPSAPVIGSASLQANSASVSFTAPASDGGSAITRYTATSSPGGLTSSGCTASPCTVTGLSNGTAYTFTVTATNGVGTSPPSAASNSVTPSAVATVPGAPTIGPASAGNGLATVAFTAPASNGGRAIIGYTATSSPGGFTSVGCTASPCTVTGLTNGTTYTFTVTATNSVGTSPASLASGPVTPRNDTGVNLVLNLSRIAPSAGSLAKADAKGGVLAAYRITVTNHGPSAVAAARLSVERLIGLTDVLWSCVAPATCVPVNGSGAVDTRFDLGAGQTLTVEFSGTVDAAQRFVDVLARVTPPAGANVAFPEDDVGTLIEAAGPNGVLKNGFER